MIRLVLVFLLFPVWAMASEELAPVEVSASKELADFHLGSSSRFDKTKSNSTLINEDLQSIPGVVGSQNGGPGSRTSFFIRGTESRHVSFTIDNLKINDPSNTDRHYDSAFLSSPFLKDITVYKGPQAVLFGSDAMGGLVDMRTRKGENAPETRLSLIGGSFGTVEGSLSQDWQKDGNKGTLTWNAFRTDGISRLNKKRFGATERDGSDMTQLASSSSHYWQEKWQTEILASFLRGNSELDGFTTDNSSDKSRTDQYLLQQRTSHELNSHSIVSLRNGVSRHQRELESLDFGESSFTGALVQNEALYQYDQNKFKFIGGLANEGESFNQDGERKEAQLNSVFLQSALKEGPFSFQAGIRTDVHSRYGEFYTGSTGIAFTRDYHSFAIQFSQGFKAPSLYQLYGNPISGLPIGNKGLEPEKNNSLEIRWSYEKEKNMLQELVFFRNDLSNLITFTNQGFINQSGFVVEGVEAQSLIKLKHWVMRPSITLQEFKHAEGPILRRPTESLGLDLSWFPRGSIELFTKLRAYNERKDIDPTGEVVKLNGYETIAVGGKINRGKVEYGFQIINLTDRNYEELFGYSVMPRSYFLNMTQKF